jgi:tetratricopeptide (TPR) repeat protein
LTRSSQEVETSRKVRERNLISNRVLAEAGTADPMELTRLGVEAATRERFERGLILLAEAYRIFSLELDVKSEAVRESEEKGEPEARRRAPGLTFSYYGLCLARTAPTRAAEAASFCEIAIQKEPTRAEHYVNLAYIWLAGHQRQKMVNALERGLAALPKSKSIKALREEIGIRGAPPLRFLSRENKLNEALGKFLRWRPKG